MRFIESIRIEGGMCQLLDYHQERVDRSLAYLGYSSVDISPYITELLNKQIISPDIIYKLRFEYDEAGIYDGTITPYQAKNILSLSLVEIDDIACYSYKYVDRGALFSPKITPSTEVIFTHKGLLTDTSYSNIVLEYTNGEMLSPRVPLLRGLMREYLLQANNIQEADISIEELMCCSRIHLINAMLPLGRLSFSPSIIEK